MNRTIFLSILIIVSSFFTGLLYYAYSHDYLIINLNRTRFSNELSEIKKKVITCWIWQHKQWLSETTEILWSENDKAKTLCHVITNWLTILAEEGAYTKKLSIQAITLLPNKCDALVSFDRTPFSKESSILEKLMWVEGLLKTVRENNNGIQSIFFLVNHQPLADMHLDFSCAWPVSGFTETALHKS